MIFYPRGQTIKFFKFIYLLIKLFSFQILISYLSHFKFLSVWRPVTYIPTALSSLRLCAVVQILFASSLQPCPTTTIRTPTPSPAATTQKATNAPTPAVSGATTIRANATRSADDSGTIDLLSWLVPTILGALAWLALSAFLIYRYCCPWRNPFAGLCRRRYCLCLSACLCD